MRCIIPGAVREKFDEVINRLGESFSLEAVLDIVRSTRNRPLHVREMRIVTGISGFAVALLDCDLIAINRQIETDRRPKVILHECSHFLLDHVTLEPYTFKQFKRAHHTLIKQRLHHEPISAYDDPIEYAAETLATMFLERVTLYEETIPPEIISMYGYKV